MKCKDNLDGGACVLDNDGFHSCEYVCYFNLPVTEYETYSCMIDNCVACEGATSHGFYTTELAETLHCPCKCHSCKC